jgi:hypothetical protein
MAYLRPLNSSESNLFITRLTTPTIATTDLTLVGNYYTIASTKYDNPIIDLLPSGFSYNIGNSVVADYMINFGSMTNPFTNPPTVTINIMNQSFRKYGGVNRASSNNIVRNHYCNNDNLTVSDKLGLLNSKILNESHIDMSNNSILCVKILYCILYFK